jgi:hypothetical protein
MMSSASSIWTLDIETLGRLPYCAHSHKPNKNKPIIPPLTCACLYNGTVEHALSFYKVADTLYDANRLKLLDILDSARVLVGFNAVHFDLEYIQRFFDLPPDRLARWVAKTVDPYLFMRDSLGITCSLGTMLAMNRLPSKSASGLIAIVWAKQGRMDLVLDYCMMDTKLTHALCAAPNHPFLLTDLWAARWTLTGNTIITWASETRSPPAPPPLLPLPSPLLSTERLVAQGLATAVPPSCI